MDAVDLRAVFERYGVPLRRKIRCINPDHDDHHPSCAVDLDKGVWFCHACGAKGGGIEAIMLLEGVDRAGAFDLAATQGFGGGDIKGGSERRYIGRVPAGKGYKPSYRRHVPSWRRTSD